jgi:hypothetical protein
MKTTKRKTKTVGQTITALFLALATFLLPTLLTVVQAQTQSKPALNDGAQEVNKAGFTLKPAGSWMNEWPNLKFNFSIERGDQSQFKSLVYTDVQARHDKQTVTIGEGDLESNAGSAKILLLLDASVSMTKTILGVSKLTGAKRALEAFINSLGANDAAAIYTFDVNAQEIVALSNDKEELLAGVEGYNIRRGGTAIYDSVKLALAKAQEQGIKNIVLLSDGCEWTPVTKWMSEEELEAYKREREREIAAISRKAGVRIFTIAIGDTDPYNPAYLDENGFNALYVDTESLSHISQSANGGNCYFIDLPKLENAAAGDGRKYYNLLVTELENVLEQIRRSFRYDYALTLRLPKNLVRDSEKHTVTVICNVGNVQLPVEISYRWSDGANQPVIEQTEIMKPVVFIKAPAISQTRSNLFNIYFLLLAILLGLAVIPTIGRSFSSNQQERQVKKSIVKVPARSSLIGLPCPIEGRLKIKEGDVVFVCPKCQTAHHLGCWNLNHNHCGIRACNHQAVIPQTVLATINGNQGR